MKRGFELLVTRSLEEKLNVTELEIAHRFKLPPIYRLFVESFILGEGCIQEERLHLEGHASFYPLKDVVHEQDPYFFTGLGTLEQNLMARKEVKAWLENAYLPIGNGAFNGAILVGTKGQEVDKIILHDFDKPPYFTIIANNVFEFIRGFVLVPNYIKRFEVNSIYKKWDEDFWRIRENENPPKTNGIL
jgi:hypothetical protein